MTLLAAPPEARLSHGAPASLPAGRVSPGDGAPAPPGEGCPRVLPAETGGEGYAPDPRADFGRTKNPGHAWEECPERFQTKPDAISEDERRRRLGAFGLLATLIREADNKGQLGAHARSLHTRDHREANRRAEAALAILSPGIDPAVRRALGAAVRAEIRAAGPRIVRLREANLLARKRMEGRQ